jgi:hypothetical protein
MKTSRNFQFRRVLVLSGIAFFSFLTYVNASGVIKGQVIDENNQPVEYATAVLKNSKTNQFVTGAVCNYKGEFVLEDVNPGEYVLTTNMIGYEKKNLQKIVVDKNQNRIVEKKVIMNEVPEKSIVVLGKKAASDKNSQIAER